MTFKWTSPRTWVAGEQPTATTMNTHIRDNLEALNGYVQKTADEPITSSTTLQNDNELLKTIPQAGTYVFDLYVFAASAANAAGDISMGFSFPTGTLHFSARGLDVALPSGTTADADTRANLSATSGTTSTNRGLSTADNMIWIHGVLIATASGTLQFMWAQATSSASASTVKSGSHMTIKQVA